MAKPLAGEAAVPCTAPELVDAQGNNVFSLPDGSASPRFAHYIAGLQAYTPDLMLVYAPFVNSYRRYVTGSQAPINLHWGPDNRTTGLRVPISTPAARRVENRIAGADANPYLAMAATLAAGLAGLEEGLSPTEAVVGNAYDHAHDLPRDFNAAHAQMAASSSARRLLGGPFVQAFLAVKRLEHDSYLREVSAWERRYLVAQA